MEANDRSNVNGKKQKKKNQKPAAKFHADLTSCSKNKDLARAIALFEDALSNNVSLNQQHLNALLYLCYNTISEPSTKDLSVSFGFRIFDHMESEKIVPNEATITAVARLAAAKGDGDYAFSLIKLCAGTARLRTYDPALSYFCETLQVDKAYEVEEDIKEKKVSIEEPQLAALLHASALTGRDERVYSYLHKLRSTVRCVSASTAKSIEEWFCSVAASEVGKLNPDLCRIKELTFRNGGGWHGEGWIGRGKWVVQKANVDLAGRCCACREQLACVDINVDDTEKFRRLVADFAMEREVESNFREFQDWLEKYSDYQAIVDGANIGLYQQNFADGSFSVLQLDAVVKELYDLSGKRPLIVLHNKRVKALVQNPCHREIIEGWMDEGFLYKTPNGSNDDWYWLYAAVKLKCLLVTNDEIRDHIYQILKENQDGFSGRNFIQKWKERHQVHYTFMKGNVKLQMPPLYSIAIQESETGWWHVPVVDDQSDESVLHWLCVTRPDAAKASDEVEGDIYTSKDGRQSDHKLSTFSITSPDHVSNELDLCRVSEKKTLTIMGKRKERSPSPS